MWIKKIIILLLVLMFCFLVLMTVPSFLGRSDLFYFLYAATFISLLLCSVFFIFSVSLKLSKLSAYGKLLRALMSLSTLWTLFVSFTSYLRQGDRGWQQYPEGWHNTNLRNSIIVFSKVFPLDHQSARGTEQSTKSPVPFPELGAVNLSCLVRWKRCELFLYSW